MTHFLAPILILFLSFTLIGNNQKQETLYVVGEYPDWKWVKFGDKETQSNFQGQVKDGKPNGLGVLTSTNGWKYFGSWKNGKILNGTEYDNLGNIVYMWVEGKRKYHNIYKSLQ